MANEEPAPKKRSDGLVGQLLANRYQIEYKLGEGAMGAVYRARHVKFGRPFAVKVLHSKLLDDQKLARRFEREAELAGRLHHPNVIGVVDVGETPDGTRYMVMDFAQGADLAEILQEAPMPPERIISLVRQLLEGLYHAHEAGLIHRDFKPENVIIERDDHGKEVPRIVDFGISLLREGGDSTDGRGRLTTNGLVLGTPHYMAPEQAVADPIDHRIDLFALGIVVYEMLSGMLPFDGAGAEVARANLLLDPPPISQRVPGIEVDPLLEAFARRLMEKNRDHRPATAKQARELLDLIERDRAAAAAALGVPREIGTRPPQATAPLPQQIRPPHLAPEAEAAPAQPTASPTAMAEPLPWGGEAPQAKRRWLIGGGVGLAAAGAIAALALGVSGGGDAKQTAAPQVAMPAAPEPAPAPPAPAAPDRAAAVPVADPPAADPAGAKTDPTPAAAAVKPDPVASKAIKDESRRKKPSSLKADAGTTKASPEETKPTPAPAKITSEPARPAETGTAAPAKAATTNEQLWADYQQVNIAIGALEKAQGAAAVQDLRQIYRHVSYTAAIGSDAKRQELMANLARIRTELANRQKR
jgi:serine/threonine-protein kinase